MTSLLSRLLRRQPRAEHLTVAVYSREKCGCCLKALDVLREIQERYGFAIEVVDIDRDPALVSKYDTEVPVVVFDGKVRFRGSVNRVLLERLLVAESVNRSETPEGTRA